MQLIFKSFVVCLCSLYSTAVWSNKGEENHLPPSTQELTSADSSGRRFGGHNFIQSDIDVTPFLTTHFSMKTGFGFGTINAPIDSFGNFTSKNRSYALGFFSEELDLQVAILPWLGIRADINGVVLAPASANSALLFGANFFRGYSVGTTVRMLHGKRYQLTSSFDIAQYSDTTVNIVDAIQKSIDKGEIAASNLLNESDFSVIKGGMQAAYAISNWIGIWGAFSYSVKDDENNDSDNENEPTTTSTVALSVDLNSLSTALPLGFLFSYNTSIKDGQRENKNGLGIFYTGRQNLLLGFETQYFTNEDDFVAIESYEGLFKMRYFW